MAYCPVDGDPDPKARGPQETPDKPGPNDEVGGAAGRIECGVEVGRLPLDHEPACMGAQVAVADFPLFPLPRYPATLCRSIGFAEQRNSATSLLSPHRCVFWSSADSRFG